MRSIVDKLSQQKIFQVILPADGEAQNKAKDKSQKKRKCKRDKAERVKNVDFQVGAKVLSSTEENGF